MPAALSSLDLTGESACWNPTARMTNRRSAGMLVAISLHLVALALALSSRNLISIQPKAAPIIADIVRPAEQATPQRPKPASKDFVPQPRMPELPLQRLDDFAPEMPSSPAMAGAMLPINVASTQDGSTETRVPAAEEPRGFGSISNREACLAAFRASFPREARRARLEGSVTIFARIGANGQLMSAEVVSANPRRTFDRAALNVLNSGACVFDTARSDYTWLAEISYRLEGESAE